MRTRTRACGFTLTGMMVGMALAIVASLAAGACFLVVRNAYAAVADSILMEERGHRALGVIAQLVRQAGWIPAQVSLASGHPAPTPPVEGHDDCGQPAIATLPACGRAGVNRSDALLVRFSGSGAAHDPTLADGTTTDCSGYALPARAAEATEHGDAPMPHHAATNLLYVGMGSDGVPQLLCRYPRRQGGHVQATTYTSGTLIRGIETLQFRYGIDADGDGKVDTFLRASHFAAHRHADWHRVRTIQVALVVLGERPTQLRDSPRSLRLLPGLNDGDNDHDQTFLPTTRPELRRRVFATTVRLRNPSPCREAVC